MRPSSPSRSCGPVLALAVATLVGCSDPTAQVTPPPTPTTPSPDAALPPIVLDTPGPKDPDLAARAAVFLGSCFHIYPVYTVDSFLWYMYYSNWFVNEFMTTMLRTTECFANKVNGCKALEECTGITQQPPGTCGATGCSGALNRLCGDQVGYHVPCDRLGLPCSHIICDDYPGELCPPGGVEPCKDGIPRFCQTEANPPTLFVGPRCADLGLVCGDAGNGFPACQGGDGACLPLSYELTMIKYYPASGGCDGTTMRMCLNSGELVKDCGTIATGFSCQYDYNHYCGLDSACYVNEKPSCDGDRIVICNGGRLDKIDCKALGFVGCDPGLGVCFPSPAGLL